MSTELTTTEAQELAQHEQTIERGLTTFVDVGLALLAIRDARLYRLEHDTFEDYCRERWGMARQRAHQLIEAAQVAENVSTIVDTRPANEAQARPLAQLEPEQQREAWALAVETAPAGKVTAALVQQAVETVTNKPHVAHNSGENEWYTPPDYIEAARRVMGNIDLDPASSTIANATVQADEFYSKDDNGLEQEWLGRVWLNPPYAAELIGPFIERLAANVEAGNVTEAVVLVNNATETGWFYRLVSVASAVLFTRGRVRFLDPQGNPRGAPLQGQALVYIGQRPDRFFAEFGKFGWGALVGVTK